ncbi:MAG: alpha-amylase family protein [Thermomicrobiales bacterium]
MEADTRAAKPWYQRCYRWGQTNLTEIDPIRYDGTWWRRHWHRTRIQGVIVNAGGIVAYYPSRFPLHHRASHLGERDFFGEIVSAAREDGLAVLARMDSNRADERFYVEHPDWFAVDAEGRPYRAGDRYVACINSPYYDEFLADVLREIIQRYQPDGVTDNSWSGLERARICSCVNCQRAFRDATGLPLPCSHDWDSQAYRRWIRWSYERRIRIWELNNRVTKDAGGPTCIWIGMNGGDLLAQSARFRDFQSICERTEIMLLDSQARSNARGFQANGEMGKLIHGLLGWEKLIPESMAMYGAGQPAFRLASKPEPEARLWALDGVAGGIQPWWHHIGAYHEDRRQHRTAEPLFRWHESHQEYLVQRRPVATVGVVWTQDNVDFYGRDSAEERVALPARGVTEALLRARIPYLPVHADHIERDAEAHDLATLILPNLGAMSDAHCANVRRFVERGGGLLSTGETSRYDEWGDPRPDFALADLFGAHATGVHHGSMGAAEPSWDDWARHTYLRLAPSLRSSADGPRMGSEPPVSGERHPALRGLDETDILPFGGRLEVVHAEAGTMAPVTYVPSFPIYPPETSWMRQPQSDVPALVINEAPGQGRVAYLAADLDRCFGRDYLPDHAAVLANLVHWTAGESIPLVVTGSGFIDCHLYRQPGRLVLHLVNLTNVGTWRAPVYELIAVGPLQVRVRVPDGIRAEHARLLVANANTPATVADEWVSFEVASIRDHEVVVID